MPRLNTGMSQIFVACRHCRTWKPTASAWSLVCSPECAEASGLKWSAIAPPEPKSVSNPRTPQLSRDTVRAIYLAKGRQVQIARDFGVFPQTVNSIKLRTNYSRFTADLVSPSEE